MAKAKADEAPATSIQIASVFDHPDFDPYAYLPRIAMPYFLASQPDTALLVAEGTPSERPESATPKES